MSKAAYMGVGGTARKVKKMYIGVNGVARKVKKAYIGVGGVARLFYSSGSDFSSSTFNSQVAITEHNSYTTGVNANGVIVLAGYHNSSAAGGIQDGEFYLGAEVIRSTDNGYTWTRITTPPIEASGSKHSYYGFNLKIISVGQNIIIIPASVGWYNNGLIGTRYAYSSNAGASWIACNAGTIIGSFGSALTYPRLKSIIATNTFFAGVVRNEARSYNNEYPAYLVRSYDGVNWEQKRTTELGLPHEENGGSVADKIFTNGKYWFVLCTSHTRNDENSHLYRSATNDPFSQYTYLTDITPDNMLKWSLWNDRDHCSMHTLSEWSYSDDGQIIIGSSGLPNGFCDITNMQPDVSRQNCYVISTDGGLTWKAYNWPVLDGYINNIGSDWCSGIRYYDNTFVTKLYSRSTNTVPSGQMIAWSTDGLNWSYKAAPAIGDMPSDIIRCNDNHFIYSSCIGYGDDTGSIPTNVYHFNG